MMIILPLFFSIARTVGHFIPFIRFQAAVGLIDMWGVSRLFFLAMLIHGIRKWRLMIHMQREINSYYEGPPLFFFNWLPAPSFWKTRIVYEPLFLIGLSIVLPNLFLVTSGVGDFLFVSAIFLAMKSFTGWYIQWENIRDLMDAKFAGPIISKLADNRETEDELATIHLASFPKDLPPEMRKAAVSQLAKQYATEEPVTNEVNNHEQ